MKPIVLLALVAAFAVTAAAQQPATAQQPAAAKQPAASFGVAAMETPNSASTALDPLTLSILQSAACPVGLKANFNSFSQMLKIRKPGTPDPGPTRGPAQHIRVILADPAHKAIASVTITVSGLTGRTRLDRSSDNFARGASGVSRTLTVPLSAAENGALFADVDLPGFTAVQGVKLESIRFADGSTREFAGKSLCSVPVNPMMLVSAR